MGQGNYQISTTDLSQFYIKTEEKANKYCMFRYVCVKILSVFCEGGDGIAK